MTPREKLDKLDADVEAIQEGLRTTPYVNADLVQAILSVRDGQRRRYVHSYLEKDLGVYVIPLFGGILVPLPDGRWIFTYQICGFSVWEKGSLLDDAHKQWTTEESEAVIKNVAAAARALIKKKEAGRGT